MQQLVTSSVPFPNIYWWHLALGCGRVLTDHAEHFVKMSYRNHYYITGANGLIQLTVPVSGGRNQRTPMAEVLADNTGNWQAQHWRSIFSAYGRAPYFEYFGPSLEALFSKNFDSIVAFNEATLLWVMRETGWKMETAVETAYRAEYPAGTMDIRNTLKPGIEKHPLPEPLYYQVFSERNGFYPNLSILDLLFAEGPAAADIIRQNSKIIESWH